MDKSTESSRFGVFKPILTLLLVIWAIQLINFVLDYRINSYLGLTPRRADGLLGLIFTPLLHANFQHIIANTTPMLILGGTVLAVSRSRFWVATISIAVLGGLLVWVFGRPNTLHVGASGLVFGYCGFLIAYGLRARSLLAIAGAIIAIVLYGGMLKAGIDFQPGVSWEGHWFGFAGGIITAWILGKNRAPKTSSKTF